MHQRYIHPLSLLLPKAFLALLQEWDQLLDQPLGRCFRFHAKQESSLRRAKFHYLERYRQGRNHTSWQGSKTGWASQRKRSWCWKQQGCQRHHVWYAWGGKTRNSCWSRSVSSRSFAWLWPWRALWLTKRKDVASCATYQIVLDSASLQAYLLYLVLCAGLRWYLRFYRSSRGWWDRLVKHFDVQTADYLRWFPES